MPVIVDILSVYLEQVLWWAKSRLNVEVEKRKEEREGKSTVRAVPMRH